MSKKLMALLSISLLILAGCSKQEQEDVANIITEDVVDSVSIDTEAPVSEEIQTTQASQEEATEELTETSGGEYLTYSEGSELSNPGKQKVLFFHALWCPTCRSLDGEINARLSELPADTVVFKADFDKDTELRQKYGVQLQHTLVFINDQGEETSRIQGPNFDALLNSL